MKNTIHSSGKEAMKRLLVSSLSVFLVLTLIAPAWAVVFSNTATITLPDAIAQGVANPYPSNITVAGLTGNATNVTVRLENLNHTFPGDLDVLLVAPNGNSLVLMSDVGGAGDVYFTNITFDDAAAAPIVAAGPIASGTFQTSRDASVDVFPAPAPAVGTNTTLAGAFNGITANGTWSLYIVDDAGGDQGTLGNGWSITITTAGSAATTFRNNNPIFLNDAARAKAATYPSTITASGLTGAISDINVTLTGVNHLNPDDLDVMLIGPTGKRLLIMSDAGGTLDLAGVNITLDDQAATVLPDATVIAAGSYQPRNYGTADTIPDQIVPPPGAAPGGTATLASVFNGTDGNGVWQLLIVDDATGSAGDVMGGWSIDITAGGGFGAKRFTSSDFDGDGKTDTAVYRRGNGFWYLRDSFALFNRSINFGAPNDSPIPGDYDGDRRTDLAVTRVSGGQVTWFILRSGSGTLETVPFGTPTDRLVPADYDADGRVDIAVWRPSNGAWYVRQSNGGGSPTLRTVVWGAVGDIPLRGHFEGSNGADFTVFRPENGTWYIRNNADTSARAVTFGAVNDQPVPGDYDADGKTDIAVWRPADGAWYIVRSSDSTFTGRIWGATGDIPAQGDFDGDSATDITVFRPSNGAWYIVNSGTFATGSSQAAVRIDTYGAGGDIALPYTYNQAAP